VVYSVGRQWRVVCRLAAQSIGLRNGPEMP
jgi:hypothetical protein